MMTLTLFDQCRRWEGEEFTQALARKSFIVSSESRVSSTSPSSFPFWEFAA
jgi:hypothetical protein